MFCRPLALAAALCLAAGAAAQDKSKFEIKFEKDKSFYQELTTDVSQMVKVQGGSDMSLKHKQVFYFKWTPVSVEKDKTVVKQTIEGVKMTVEIAGNPINYDSTDPNPSGAAANPGLADFFKSLVGAEFTITFGPGLKVEKVDGRDDFLKKLAGANPQMEALLKKLLSDDALREMVDPSAGLTPSAEQAVGSSWEKTSTLSLGPIGSYVRTFKYTYKGKDSEKKELDRVEVDPKLAYKSPTDAAEGLLFRIKSGTLETINPKPGVILYNAKTGRVESSDITLTMKGSLDVALGTTDTKIELFQEQKTSVKTQDTPFLTKK
jgi:hypothetical protein